MARRPLASPSIATPTEVSVESNSSVSFTSSGSFLLDLVLGGGWAQGRIANIVGDRSSGKTLLAIEAAINYARLSSPNNVRYAEAEAAFDIQYATRLGFPTGIQMTGEREIRTVEQFAADLLVFLEKRRATTPSLYILDSLDALSDESELERDLGDATYGTARAKLLSEFFRKHVGDIGAKNCTLFVISQIRDKIGVTFGETKTRSGGRALDFYASQIVWLAETGKIKRTIRGVERVVGLHVQARTKKNKVGMAFREAELDIIFNYGVDDEVSMFNWLKKNKAGDLLPMDMTQARRDIDDARESCDRVALAQIRAVLRTAVQTRWREVEESLAPTMSKYE